MAKKALTKKEFETLSEFRYRLRPLPALSERVTRKNGITPLQYLLLLHLKGLSRTQLGDSGRTRRAAAGPASRRGGADLPLRKAGLGRTRQGKADRREVEVHLTTSGERTAAKMAQLHRDEHLNPAGSFLLPQLLGLQDG
jgi:hypothetical protein